MAVNDGRLSRCAQELSRDRNLIIGLSVSGSPMSIDDFKGTKPLFLPERFFVGRLEGWAVVESPIGGLLQRATIASHGEFESDTQTILFTESYTFDDGHSDTLHWTIRKGDEGKYTGL